MRALIFHLFLFPFLAFNAVGEEYEELYDSFQATNKSIGPAEFYWLLNRACSCGDDLGVKMLLSAGADPDGATDYKKFLEKYPGFEPSWPINQAAWKGHDKVIGALLKAGAKVDKPEGEGLTALFIATMKNHPSTVKLLLDAGANLQRKEALKVAREKGFHGIIALLEQK